MIQNKRYTIRLPSAHFDAIVPTIPGLPGALGTKSFPGDLGIKSVPGDLDPYVIYVSPGTSLTTWIT